jgi:predicted nuclease of restriction endonuclease-like RecB superfamily
MENSKRGNSGAGWAEFPDGKKCYLRSTWELKYAKYLEFLKKHGHIIDWQYEPVTFWFEGIKRGTNNYKPDFQVTMPDQSIYYVEVKGYWDSKSLTKIKRMKKYHPSVNLKTVDKEWFSAMNRKLKGIVW